MNIVFLTTLPGVSVLGGRLWDGRDSVVITAGISNTPVSTVFKSDYVFLDGHPVRPRTTLAQLGARRDAVLQCRRRPRLALPGGAKTLEEFLSDKDPTTTTEISGVPGDVTGKQWWEKNVLLLTGHC